MQTYIILSKILPGSFSNPKDFKKVAVTVAEKIKAECPGVVWKDSYSTTGSFDVVDVVESDHPDQVQRASMIIRSFGNAHTETLPATPWRQFLKSL
jgi:uncharacterized protein with GYD domain